MRATSRQPSPDVEHVFSLSRRSNPAGGIFSQQSGDPFSQHHQMLPSAVSSSPPMFHSCSSHQCVENTTNKSLTLLFVSGLASMVSAIQMRPVPMHPLPSRPSVSFPVRSQPVAWFPFWFSPDSRDSSRTTASLDHCWNQAHHQSAQAHVSRAYLRQSINSSSAEET
jgi:hypothetical protein